MVDADALADPPPPAITDDDRDALHILPLAILPLQTPALLRARMIKNAALESVIELFSDARTGSGQIDIDMAAAAFRWDSKQPHPDHEILLKLGLLPSFDVYSLRILLRRQGLVVNDAAHLKLSSAKNAELTGYMKQFTRPLIAQVYGSDNVSVDSFEGLVALFRDPDGRKAVARLKMLASKLEIPVHQVPRFLEEYGDVFLSLSYYRQAFDRLGAPLDDLRGTLGIIAKHHQLARNATLMETCNRVYGDLASALNNIRKRLASFDQTTGDMWSDISAERFRQVRRTITESHATIGGILCALSVKLDAWTRTFPLPDAGGPVRRADFIITEMRRGLEKIRHLETAASAIAA